MRRYIAQIFAAIALCTLAQGCTDEVKVPTFQMGTVSYHPAFLWTDAEMVPLEKTMVFDFSDDAKKSATEVFAEFEWVDNDGKPLDMDKFLLSVDGEQLTKNLVRVTARDTKKTLSICVNPKIETGKYQGYLRLRRSNLDRLGNEEVHGTAHPDAFQWTFYYEQNMNPLAKLLMWIGIAVAALLFVWFAVIRPAAFPHFKSFKKVVTVTQNGKVIIGGRNINCTGKWKYVFANKKVKQSVWERIFCGKIETLVDPAFESKLTLKPDKKNGRASGPGYFVERNPIQKVGGAKITHNSGLQIDIR